MAEKLWDAWGEVPEFLEVKNKSTLIINGGSEWEGYRKHKITIEDVVQYYAVESRNIVSGCRRLGTIIGDWRNIDYLAKMCLEAFKVLNMEKLRTECIKKGLIPKF